MSIYIKYSNNNWVTDTKITLDPILDRTIVSTSKVKGTSLRGYDFSHRLYNKTKRLIRISADQLQTDTQKQNIRAIWTAGGLKYSSDDVTYFDVVLKDDGDYSPELIDDDENLEEIEFVLIYREPN